MYPILKLKLVIFVCKPCHGFMTMYNYYKRSDTLQKAIFKPRRETDVSMVSAHVESLVVTVLTLCGQRTLMIDYCNMAESWVYMLWWTSEMAYYIKADTSGVHVDFFTRK